MAYPRVGYQVAGPGKSSSVAWCDPRLVPDSAEWLTGRVGTLVWCNDGGEPEPPPLPKPPAARTPRPATALEPTDPSPMWADAPPPPDDPADPGWSIEPDWSRYAVDPEIPGSQASVTPCPVELPMSDQFDAALWHPRQLYPVNSKHDVIVDVVTLPICAIERSGFAGRSRHPWDGIEEPPTNATPLERAVYEALSCPPIIPNPLAREIDATIGRMSWSIGP